MGSEGFRVFLECFEKEFEAGIELATRNKFYGPKAFIKGSERAVVSIRSGRENASNAKHSAD